MSRLMKLQKLRSNLHVAKQAGALHILREHCACGNEVSDEVTVVLPATAEIYI